MGRHRVIRGALSRQATRVVPGPGGLVEHIPVRTADPDEGFAEQAVSLAGRVLWRYRVEVATLIVPVMVWWWLRASLAATVADLALLLVLAAVIVVEWRTRWLRRAWWAAGFRRAWDKACRHAWVTNLDERTPRVHQLVRVPVGERFVVSMPAGTCVPHLDKVGEEIASNLRVRDVRIVRDPGNANLAAVTVVRRDPFADTAATRWPVLDHRGAVSLWQPVPVGIDEDGDPVTIALPERNVLIGGEPGAGKSVAVSQLVAAAALDPTVRLSLFDGKVVELAVWRDCADHVVDVDIDAAIDILERLQREMADRYERLLDTGARKVAPDLGLPLHVVVVDELAFYLATDAEAKTRRRIAGLFRDLVARGRAAGVIVLAATQRPSHDIVPTSLRDLFGFRWALRCSSRDASDTILGAGQASLGHSAATIDPATRGVGYLLAEGGTPVRCRSHHVTDADLDELAARAVELRRRDDGPDLRVAG